jgi:hypothetical protein
MNKKINSHLKERVLEALEFSFNQEIKAGDLAQFANISEMSDTCPVTRGIIRDMINDGELIGSNSKGYFIMKDGKEVQQCLNALLKRTIGINKRIQSIYDAAKLKGIL